jgi:hypothetical protein
MIASEEANQYTSPVKARQHETETPPVERR